MTEILAFLESRRDQSVNELAECLSIPSISALPEHACDIRRCADWISGAMRQAGLQNVHLIETLGNPIVYGDWLGANGKPTVLCYGHYDVQPVDPLDEWQSPPFTPTIRDGCIYARGASDDKGQFYGQLKAIEAHLQSRGRLPVNVKVIVEGEEEVGGTHLNGFVRENRDLLSADVAVISDTAMLDRNLPSICCGTRGHAYFQIELRGAGRDLHSGSFGGAVSNPALVLAQILARMKDEAGRIMIPGFYEKVRPLTAYDQAELAKIPFDPERYRADLGVPELSGEQGYTTLERLWIRPTFDVAGLLSGFTGTGMKTVIPSIAMAKVTMRLVPDQDPSEIAELFESYLKTITPASVHARITLRRGARPWVADVRHPFMAAAARAMQFGFGALPLFAREGGSNPILSTFKEILELPVIMFGIGSPLDNPHAANENLELANFHRGTVALARFFDEIAAAG